MEKKKIVRSIHATIYSIDTSHFMIYSKKIIAMKRDDALCNRFVDFFFLLNRCRCPNITFFHFSFIFIFTDTTLPSPLYYVSLINKTCNNNKNKMKTKEEKKKKTVGCLLLCRHSIGFEYTYILYDVSIAMYEKARAQNCKI